jgi:hypothetical protein
VGLGMLVRGMWQRGRGEVGMRGAGGGGDEGG